MSKSNLFTQVQVLDTRSNTFNLSHDRKQSFNMGDLVPAFLMETLPGDVFNVDWQHLIRLAPMVAPMMHKVDVYVHFFYAPTRILWSGMPDFIRNTDAGVPVYPYVEFKDPVLQSSIPDYMGIPVGDWTAGQEKISAVPFAMYAKIWDEYYRDQNLNTEIGIELTDGDNSTEIVAANLMKFPFKRAWTQDYFTSCLPFTQKGSPVTLPLGTSADIQFFNSTIASTLRNIAGGNVSAGQLNAEAPDQVAPDIMDDSGHALAVDNSANLKVNLSTAAAASIESLRLAWKMQQYFELVARTGSRYTEAIRAQWGVTLSDKSLQRPIYLGGSKAPLVVSEVLQTSETNDTVTPQGTMAGHGYSTNSDSHFNYFCEEHGYIMGIISIMPKPAYMQGLAKHWWRLNKFDFYHPIFANLGEQAVLNKEIYFNADTADKETFGYQARWAEYRDMPSSVHGMFRNELDFWHMANDYATRPHLNADFIACNATQRIFAVQSTEEFPIDNIWAHIAYKVLVKRKMPVFGIPQII